MASKLTFRQQVESKQSKKFLKELRKTFDKAGMNFDAFLCLLWQAETGKECQNRNHKKGVYKRNHLECEAQVVQSLCLTLAASSISDSQIKNLCKVLYKAAIEIKKSNPSPHA